MNFSFNRSGNCLCLCAFRDVIKYLITGEQVGICVS